MGAERGAWQKSVTAQVCTSRVEVSHFPRTRPSFRPPTLKDKKNIMLQVTPYRVLCAVHIAIKSPVMLSSDTSKNSGSRYEESMHLSEKMDPVEHHLNLIADAAVT